LQRRGVMHFQSRFIGQREPYSVSWLFCSSSLSALILTHEFPECTIYPRSKLYPSTLAMFTFQTRTGSTGHFANPVVCSLVWEEFKFQSRTGGMQGTYLRKVEHLFRSTQEQVTPQLNSHAPFRFPLEHVISHST